MPTLKIILTSGLEGRTRGLEGMTSGLEGRTSGLEGRTGGLEGRTSGNLKIFNNIFSILGYKLKYK